MIESHAKLAHYFYIHIDDICRVITNDILRFHCSYIYIYNVQYRLLVNQAIYSTCTYFIIYFQGNYDGSSSEKFKYARSILRFDVPSPVTDANGTLQLPKINAFILNAFNCTSDAHNAHSLDAQLARRDLTVVPTFLPQSFDKHEKKALPGALILSGVFQQDGSNAPFLQPIIFSFNQKDTTINPPNGQDASIATTIPSFQVGSFFQLYNNYSCASVQLFSPKDSAIYNILLGGVSYFYKSPEGGMQ